MQMWHQVPWLMDECCLVFFLSPDQWLKSFNVMDLLLHVPCAEPVFKADKKHDQGSLTSCEKDGTVDASHHLFVWFSQTIIWSCSWSSPKAC